LNPLPSEYEDEMLTTRQVLTAANMKMTSVILRLVTDILEVLDASIIRAMSDLISERGEE
jgi:hypothetical protein